LFFKLEVKKSDFPVSIFPTDASGHYWTVFGQDRATAARVERNGVWQTMKCVSAATYRQCHISLISARWPNSTAVYYVYTLQKKLLLIGWHHMAPIEGYETHKQAILLSTSI